MATMLYALGIDLMIDIPIIFIIMGLWGIYVGFYYFSKNREKYRLGWGIIITIIGVLWILNVYIPEYNLYLLALLFLILGGLIIFLSRI